MRRLAGLAVGLAVYVTAHASAAIKRTQHPAVSPDGQTIAFSWQGDIWTVPVKGGTASRLTVNDATEDNPVWTPTGGQIVFTSNRFGSTDVFVMASDGSDVRRVTFDSSSEIVSSVSADGKTLYGHTNAWGRSNLFRVPISGGDMIRLTGHPLETCFQPAVSADGLTVLYCTPGGATTWKKPGLQGSPTPHVWVARNGVPLTAMRKVTASDHYEMTPVVLDSRRFLAISNRSGVPNLWLFGMDGRGNQVTRLTDGTISSVSASALGRVAVFEHDSAVWSVDLDTGATSEVRINAPEDSRRPAVAKLVVSSGVTDFVVAPDSKRILIEARGDLFLIPESGGTTRQVTENPAYDGSPCWLDSKTYVYVAAGPKAKRRLVRTGLDGKESVLYESDLDATNPTLSPDGKWLAFHRGDREICVMSTEGGDAKTVATGDFSGTYAGNRRFNWSPDSEWLAVTSDNGRSTDVMLVRRDGSEKVLVGRLARGEGAPQFLPDGRSVLAIGTEGLDFDEARNSTSSIYIFDLTPPETKFTEDDLDTIGVTKKKEVKPVVRIVRRGLEDRKRRLVRDVDSFYITDDPKSVIAVNASGTSRVSVPSGQSRPIANVGRLSNYRESNGKAFFVMAGKLYSLPPRADSPVPVGFSATIRVDNLAEEKALFEDAWRALRNQFYDPKMHGKDWDHIHDVFAAIVPSVTSRDDFYNLLGEMVERLDSSHQGATSSDPFRAADPDLTSYLGVEWDWPLAARGLYRVARVSEGTPASLPDSELHVGDELVSINGVDVGAQHPVTPLLNDLAGRKTVLVIKRGSTRLNVTIKPAPPSARSAADIRDWVSWEKATVDRLSGGKLAYFHIAAMDARSLDDLLVAFRTELVGKKGLILDVRYNGGGFTSHIILNLLRKATWLERTQRDVPGEWVSENIMRGDSVELPCACLTNWASFSNAEIFSEGFRRLKIGPVIGERTGGYVIGTGSYRLWDGGAIRMPSIGVYTMEGENLEHNGRRPDIEVPFDPNAWAAGRDLQLEKAVEAMLKHLG